MEDLTKFKIQNDPIETFKEWLLEAQKVDDNPEAFALATSAKDGTPSVRYLLFKGLSSYSDFKFYTNYNSEKSKDLDDNPRASMAFFWRNSARQVRISGRVTRMSTEDSKAYFHSRDRESQIASAVSNQSSKISSREELLKNYSEYLDEIKDSEVPYPDNWGGYLLEAIEIEFFIYGEHRLNDRFLFKKKDEISWEIQRLQP